MSMILCMVCMSVVLSYDLYERPYFVWFLLAPLCMVCMRVHFCSACILCASFFSMVCMGVHILHSLDERPSVWFVKACTFCRICMDVLICAHDRASFA